MRVVGFEFVGRLVGVVVVYFDVFGWDVEFFGDDLRECRLVFLFLGLG